MLQVMLDTISNHSDYLLQKWLAAGSLISFPAGLILGLSNDTIHKITSTTEAAAQAASEALGLPDYAAIVSMVLGICGVIQIAVNIYYKIKNGGKS